jgi:hypothetical protein
MGVEQMLIWQEKPRIRFVKTLTSISLSPFLKTNFKEQERRNEVNAPDQDHC